jgi:serine phosphatase RsbU (regulator of sigma subunit)
MDARPIQVLLVEDNPGDARLLQLSLAEATSAQFELTHVERLADALQRLSTQTFDVVLLDLSLPDSRQIDTFRRTRAHAPQLPIIVLTGLDDETLAVETVHEGAQDYLVKGHVDSHLLVRAIRYAIERKRAQEQLARYADELRQKNEQLEADLQLASEIQLAFLPQQYPALPRGVDPQRSALRFFHAYKPTGAIGGDFFDVLALSDTQAGLFICDVMGHGVRAALVTAILHALVQEQAALAGQPGRFLAEINRGLRAALARTRTPLFASAFHLVADVATGRMRYAGAGHPSPLHVRRAAGVVEPLQFGGDRAGPALGLFEDAEFPENESELAGHDLVMLYTDGIYEVADANGVEFGKERVLAATLQRISLPTEKLFEELLIEAQQFSADGGFADDVCLVGMELAGTLPPR